MNIILSTIIASILGLIVFLVHSYFLNQYLRTKNNLALSDNLRLEIFFFKIENARGSFSTKTALFTFLDKHSIPKEPIPE